MNKQQVDDLLAEFERDANGPVQLSDEWFAIRNEQIVEGVTRIGGSEISSLMGENPYCNTKQLILYKSGKQEKKMGGMMACWFGTMFEEVAVMVLETIQSTKVHCKNISLIDKVLVGMMYSPDGIIALPVTTNGDPIINDSITDEEHVGIIYSPVMVEIKCPFRRLPKEQMPKYYYSQLQAGLLNIPIVTGALFVDNLFRICHKNHLTFNTFFAFHLFPQSPYINASPLVFGYILLNTKEHEDKKKIDLGELKYDAFETLMEGVTKGKYDITYSKVFIYPEECTDTLEGETYNYVMCWKLFDIKYTFVGRDDIHITKIYDKVSLYLSGGLNYLVA